MGAIVFSDVHADAGAIAALRSWIRKPAFVKNFGAIDVVVNLGDILHRGDHPKEALEHVHALAHEFRLVSVIGNHDHAFLNGLLVSGSDAASTYRHEQLRGSPLLSIFSGMPMEWEYQGILFVHGGPIELDSYTLHLKCWQRLGRETGDSYTGYHYTPEMAFSAIRSRGLTHMCCGHQHDNLCCKKMPEGIKQHELVFTPVTDEGSELGTLHVAEVPLDIPTILRVGACHGTNPEFAYTDFTSFSFIRIGSPGLPL